MKRIGIAVLITAVIFAFSGCKGGEDITINEKNFPDEHIRTAVQEFDTDNNGKLSPEECANVTSINISSAYDLRGLEHFTNVNVLELSGIAFVDLDFGCFKDLKEIKISCLVAPSIDLSSNIKLETIDFFSRSTKEMKLPQTATLKTVSCQYCQQLSVIDVSGCTGLEELYINDTNLQELDVSNCHKLIKLACHRNKLTGLNISGCSKLEDLCCYENRLTSIDLAGCCSLTQLFCKTNELTELDLSPCPDLIRLECDENKLTKLDLTHCPALKSLSCSNNEIDTLDVSCCPELISLGCFDSGITKLTLGNCRNLDHLICYDNALAELDVSGCPKLSWLGCHHNNLTVLDISACPLLIEAVNVAAMENSKLNCYIYNDNDGHGLYVDKHVELILEEI